MLTSAPWRTPHPPPRPITTAGTFASVAPPTLPIGVLMGGGGTGGRPRAGMPTRFFLTAAGAPPVPPVASASGMLQSTARLAETWSPTLAPSSQPSAKAAGKAQQQFFPHTTPLTSTATCAPEVQPLGGSVASFMPQLPAAMPQPAAVPLAYAGFGSVYPPPGAPPLGPNYRPLASLPWSAPAHAYPPVPQVGGYTHGGPRGDYMQPVTGPALGHGGATAKPKGLAESITEAAFAAARAELGSGPIRVKCPEPGCDGVFKCDLLIHTRNHTGERPFKCDFEGCGKAFTSKAVLTTHKRIHTGDRPYKCREPGCNRAFTQRSNYARHIKVHVKGSSGDLKLLGSAPKRRREGDYDSFDDYVD